MSSATDMSTPVTRGELREAIAEAIAPLATKADLGAMEQRLGAMEQRLGAMEQRLGAMEQRLLDELARHANAICETLATQIAASAEAFADLPGRVRRLEVAVFTPRRR